ncbi:MAG TPA: hypothetical protein VNL71_04660 [Chloroflexota bacterium]|nr:hypothetical protein [Chloroflexota bacterium]
MEAFSTGPTVALSFPADKAIVTGSDLPLTWSPFPHASAYLVHVWLLKADPGQAVTDDHHVHDHDWYAGLGEHYGHAEGRIRVGRGGAERQERAYRGLGDGAKRAA